MSALQAEQQAVALHRLLVQTPIFIHPRWIQIAVTSFLHLTLILFFLPLIQYWIMQDTAILYLFTLPVFLIVIIIPRFIIREDMPFRLTLRYFMVIIISLTAIITPALVQHLPAHIRFYPQGFLICWPVLIWTPSKKELNWCIIIGLHFNLGKLYVIFCKQNKGEIQDFLHLLYIRICKAGIKIWKRNGNEFYKRKILKYAIYFSHKRRRGMESYTYSYNCIWDVASILIIINSKGGKGRCSGKSI